MRILIYTQTIISSKFKTVYSPTCSSPLQSGLWFLTDEPGIGLPSSVTHQQQPNEMWHCTVAQLPSGLHWGMNTPAVDVSASCCVAARSFTHFDFSGNQNRNRERNNYTQLKAPIDEMQKRMTRDFEFEQILFQSLHEISNLMQHVFFCFF